MQAKGYSRSVPHITAENAAEMARRSHVARKLHEEERAAKLALAEQTPLEAAGHEQFIKRRLARVRKQLERIDGMVDEEDDPAKLDRLASASARLSEIERQLADRPLPGSRRPAPEKPPGRPSAAVPIIPPAS